MLDASSLPRNAWVLSLTSLLRDVASKMLVHLLPLFLANVLSLRLAVMGLTRHHRGMASAIDDCPVRVLASLKRGWHSPLEACTPVLPGTGPPLPARRTPMDRYTGLDAHASSRYWGSQVVETNAKALIEVLSSIPGPRHLCPEAGTLASWLYEILSPHVIQPP